MSLKAAWPEWLFSSGLVSGQLNRLPGFQVGAQLEVNFL
jgi:hypothetical protein